MAHGFVMTAATHVEDIRRRFDRLVAQLRDPAVRSVLLVYVHHVVAGQMDLVVGDAFVDEAHLDSLLRLVDLVASNCPQVDFCHIVALNLAPFDFHYGPITNVFVGYPPDDQPWASVGSMVGAALPSPIYLSETLLSRTGGADSDDDEETSAFM